MATGRQPPAGVMKIAAWLDWSPLDTVESVITTGATAVEALVNDPDALALILQNIGANDINVGLTPKVSATNGMLLKVGAAPLIIPHEQMPWLAKRAFYAISPAGASSLYVIRSRITG